MWARTSPPFHGQEAWRRSTPYADVSWLMTSSSFVPAATSFSASRRIASGRRLTRSPRIEGMMQKLQR
jgi:hypothetical protein